MGDFIRREYGFAKKYRLEVVDGFSEPQIHHEDGWTKWKNGKPRSHTRAINVIRVGRQWLHREFPASYALGALTGVFELLDVDLRMRRDRIKL